MIIFNLINFLSLFFINVNCINLNNNYNNNDELNYFYNNNIENNNINIDLNILTKIKIIKSKLNNLLLKVKFECLNKKSLNYIQIELDKIIYDLYSSSVLINFVFIFEKDINEIIINLPSTSGLNFISLINNQEDNKNQKVKEAKIEEENIYYNNYGWNIELLSSYNFDDEYKYKEKKIIINNNNNNNNNSNNNFLLKFKYLLNNIVINLLSKLKINSNIINNNNKIKNENDINKYYYYYCIIKKNIPTNKLIDELYLKELNLINIKKIKVEYLIYKDINFIETKVKLNINNLNHELKKIILKWIEIESNKDPRYIQIICDKNNKFFYEKLKKIKK